MLVERVRERLAAAQGRLAGVDGGGARGEPDRDPDHRDDDVRDGRDGRGARPAPRSGAGGAGRDRRVHRLHPLVVPGSHRRARRARRAHSTTCGRWPWRGSSSTTSRTSRRRGLPRGEGGADRARLRPRRHGLRHDGGERGVGGGTTHRLDVPELQRLIEEAGLRPVQRDTYYRPWTRGEPLRPSPARARLGAIHGAGAGALLPRADARRRSSLPLRLLAVLRQVTQSSPSPAQVPLPQPQSESLPSFLPSQSLSAPSWQSASVAGGGPAVSGQEHLSSKLSQRPLPHGQAGSMPAQLESAQSVAESQSSSLPFAQRPISFGIGGPQSALHVQEVSLGELQVPSPQPPPPGVQDVDPAVAVVVVEARAPLVHGAVLDELADGLRGPRGSWSIRRAARPATWGADMLVPDLMASRCRRSSTRSRWGSRVP